MTSDVQSYILQVFLKSSYKNTYLMDSAQHCGIPVQNWDMRDKGGDYVASMNVDKLCIIGYISIGTFIWPRCCLTSECNVRPTSNQLELCIIYLSEEFQCSCRVESDDHESFSTKSNLGIQCYHKSLHTLYWSNWYWRQFKRISRSYI